MNERDTDLVLRDHSPLRVFCVYVSASLVSPTSQVVPTLSPSLYSKSRTLPSLLPPLSPSQFSYDVVFRTPGLGLVIHVSRPSFDHKPTS